MGANNLEEKQLGEKRGGTVVYVAVTIFCSVQNLYKF